MSKSKVNMPKELKRKCSIIIHSATGASTVAGLIPIPMSDAIPITAAQIGMIIKIGDLFDISLSEAAAKSIAGVALTQQAGRSVASGFLKMIPGVGTLIGGMISGATAAVLTEFLGWVVADDFFRMSQGEDPENIVEVASELKGSFQDVRLKKADKMLDLVNLGKHKKHMPNQMSGGQQQRVGVARALVVDPKIIFADEPTGNLDSHTSEEVMELMQQVVRQQKKTLVMVTHDNHLATYADRVFHISDGKIIKIEDHRSGTEHTEDRDKAISGNMNPGDTEYLKR